MLVVYVGAGVALGVVSNRLQRWKVLLAFVVLFCLALIGAAWPTRHLLETISATIAWYWLPYAAALLVPFLLGRYVARFLVKKRGTTMPPRGRTS